VDKHDTTTEDYTDGSDSEERPRGYAALAKDIEAGRPTDTSDGIEVLPTEYYLG